jgi:endonuclease G, mitochondrial
MVMDDEIDTELVQKASEASRRWSVRTDVRESRTLALEQDEPLKADTPSRLAARLNHLIADVRRSSEGRRVPNNPVLRSLVERPTPVTAEEVNREIVNEVVNGARDFLSIEFFERAVIAARSVGRVLISSAAGTKARGTGFLVAPGLLLTNEHVLSSEEVARRCALEMDYEQNRFGPTKQPQVFALDPGRFFLNDAKLDYALVAVAPKSDRGMALDAYGWLPLNGAQGKISISDIDFVNIVQHPLGGEKQVVFRNNRVLDLRTADDVGADELGAFLHYEADTEKGSSGSPVMSDSWEVVGLHHSGVPDVDGAGNWLDKDGAIWRKGEQPVDRIRWIANEAVRVSSVVGAVAIAQLDAGKRQILNEALSAQPPTSLGERTEAEEKIGPGVTATAPRAERPPISPVRAAAGGSRRARISSALSEPDVQSAVLEVPLRITFSLAEHPSSRLEVASGPMSHAASLTGNALLLERLDPSDMADRDGYSRNFLGVSIPLPKLKAQPRFGGALRVPRPARTGDRIELRYYNYSVIMCKDRRIAYVSACNLNFDAPATASRDKGRGDFRLDPRLDDSQQLGNRFYASNDYDKGHLTRRDDTAWGDSLEQAVASNDDTFFYPNAAPQHYLFNRSDAFTGANLDLWGDLENFISEQGAGQRARLTIFNGPIFGDQDKPLHDTLVPLRYYKIVVWADDNQPGAVGFILDQSDLVADLAEEAIDVGRFEIRQRRIAEIEEALDITFGRVKEWDRMPPDVDEVLEGDGLLISDPSDMRL